MKRVEAASGANYSTHKEQARKFEPIAPVGTNYTPVGKVDIGALRKAPTTGAGASLSRPAIPSAPRPSYGASSMGPSASFNAPTTGRAPAGAWDDETPATAAPPPPPPAASRPPVTTSTRPTTSVRAIFNHILPFLIVYRL